MTRFLLALLAMLTGIAAAGQPVAARVYAEGASAVRPVDCAPVVEGSGARALAQAPPCGPQDRRAECVVTPEAVPAAGADTVRIRCDRALE
jgi:hypothetical protein